VKHIVDLVVKGAFVSWVVSVTYLMSTEGLGAILTGLFSGNLLVIFQVFGLWQPAIQLAVGCGFYYLYSWAFMNDPGVIGPLMRTHRSPIPRRA